MPTHRLLAVLVAAAITASLAVGPYVLGAAVETTRIRWKKIVIDPVFRAEGAAAADVSGDGKPPGARPPPPTAARSKARLPRLAGNLWYEAPHWTPHEIRRAQEFRPATGYRTPSG